MSDDKAWPEAVPDEFGGYRVVRVVSGTAIATTLLVRSADETRVARVFSANCPSLTIDTELAVHDVIARSEPVLREHVVALHDMVTVTGGRLALILDLAAGPTLDDVLAPRSGMVAIGEAVTILAPLAEALDAAHAVGLTGLSYEPSAVRFSASGAPILVGVSDAVAGPPLPERFRALEPAYVRDHAGFERLAATVTAAVTAEDRPALTAALAAPRRGMSAAEALFDRAAPVPVLLYPESVSRSLSTPEQPLRGGETAHAVAAPLPDALIAPDQSPSPRWLAVALESMGAVGVPAALLTTISTTVRAVICRVDSLAAHVSSLVRNSTTARPRFIVAGAAGLVALTVALVIVVAPGTPREPVGLNTGGDEALTETAPRPSSVVETAVAREARDAAAEASRRHRESPETLTDPNADDWPVLITELVSRWVTCRAEFSSGSQEAEPTCSVDVAHRGSPAEALLGHDDQRHTALEQWLGAHGESVVVDRMGGAAVIDLVIAVDHASRTDAAAPTTTASLLVVRSEAGWRIRTVLSAELPD